MMKTNQIGVMSKVLTMFYHHHHQNGVSLIGSAQLYVVFAMLVEVCPTLENIGEKEQFSQTGLSHGRAALSTIVRIKQKYKKSIFTLFQKRRKLHIFMKNGALV
jgi:hypothetical protein